MKLTALILAILSTAAGTYSAYWWWRSSKVRFVNRVSNLMVDRQVVVGSRDIEVFLAASAKMNQKAALGSAIAVFLAGVSSVFGSLAP